MAKKTTNNEETKRPITVEDHREQSRRHAKTNKNAVTLALGFPGGDEFEKDLTEILEGDCESKGETVVVALVDFDNFYHINDDFG
ncbi:MAG: GGDEF domain-containing protein, partial [Lachnospiraceae bacterium]|nr:GGDEF domain-containing protein [Lachnospiraceae bacterium]